jgi:hypothetical protein
MAPEQEYSRPNFLKHLLPVACASGMRVGEHHDPHHNR